MDKQQEPVQQEPVAGEPRTSRLTGRKIEFDKPKKPEIVVTVELSPPVAPAVNVYVEEGPAARRAEPREPVTVAQTANVGTLEAAVQRDRRSERQRVEDTKAMLRDKYLPGARAVVKVFQQFRKEHLDFYQRLDAVLSSGQLYVQLVGRTGQRQAAADRTNALHGVVREVLRVLNVGVNLADQVEAAIDAVTLDGLTPTMSAPGGGYESDGMRAPSIMAVARLASTSTVEGVTKTLDEKLAYTQMLVSQIAERLGQSPVEVRVADIVRPEEMENRERARPYSQRYAANSGNGTKAEHADWDPLNYRPGR